MLVKSNLFLEYFSDHSHNFNVLKEQKEMYKSSEFRRGAYSCDCEKTVIAV